MHLSEPVECVSIKTIAARLDIAVSTAWRMVQDGRLPQPSVKFGKRCTRWRWTDVEDALTAQSAIQGGAA